MSKQNTLRLVIGVILLAVAGLVIATWSNSGALAPAAIATAVPPTPPSPTPATDEAAATSSAPVDTATGAGNGGTAVPFVIDQAMSEARFLVNETLLGVPTEVKGVTNLISGTIEIDAANPAETSIGTITIDARDLRTDRDLRNRSIRRFILESGKDEYRYITFTPTAIQGLPVQAAAGDTFSFEITGDLKIKDVSKPVTFTVDLNADSDVQVSGLATATISRADFDLSIPSAPGVADVTDEVRLELAFTARAE